VERDFIYQVLGKLGFPETIINWIKTLYKGARATIIVNGNIGDGIEFERGIKKGCPLFMYLYIIYIEPLIKIIKRYA
jgi:hypothetical protein